MPDQLQVICTDDSQRPAAIAPENWIAKDRIYTVVKVWISLSGMPALQLEERDPHHPAYKGYRITRFQPLQDVPLDQLIADLNVPIEEDWREREKLQVTRRERVEELVEA
jgi:hypothetical protein